ncbi:metal-dependent hydrolase, partial [bacterium]
FNGHANFHFTDGRSHLLIDPWFTGNPSAKGRPFDYDQIDLILLTHGHRDHLGDAIDISKKYQAPIAAPFELAMFCQRRGASVAQMNHGGKLGFDFCTAKMVNAVHSSAFVDKGAEYTGNPCGYIIEMGGKKVYFTGDTAIFGDMKLYGELEKPEIMILPIGGVFTMGPEDAALAVGMVAPKFAIPMHFGTFEILEQSADSFAKALLGSKTEAVALAPGQSATF